MSKKWYIEEKWYIKLLLFIQLPKVSINNDNPSKPFIIYKKLFGKTYIIESGHLHEK